MTDKPVPQEVLNAARTFNRDKAPQQEGKISGLREVLKSESMMKTIRDMPPEIRQAAVGSLIEFHILHQDGFGVDEFMDGIAAGKEVARLLVDSVIERLEVSPDTQEGRRAVFDYFHKHLFEEGYIFHAFNGTFEDDIVANGLSTEKRKWDWDELQEITKIGKQHG
jgi:hypothetical protein